MEQQRFQLTIEDITHEGLGLGRADGMAVFVPDALVGDQLTVELTKAKKNYAFAKIISIDKASPHRVEPFCPHFIHGCGGCPLAKLDYQGQLALKEKQVYDKLTRLGGLKEPAVKPIIAMEEPVRYRNKAVFSIGMGEPVIGFYKSKSHQIIDCPNCMIQSKAAMAAAEVVRRFMKEEHTTAWDADSGKGLLRHLIVKTAFGTGEVMVILVVNGRGIPNGQTLVELLNQSIQDTGYSLESVFLNVNKKKNTSVLGEEFILLAGKRTIPETIGELTFEISPGSFYQVNPLQTVRLFEKVMEYTRLTGKEKVLDLYCGVGTLGLACAANAKSVVGIESVKSAILDANRNAVINGIVNARFVHGKAEEVLPEMLNSVAELECIKHADVVILDPPKAGCKRELLQAVAELKPDRLVYVSCDPATLARDIKILSGFGYTFMEATPVDMFPHTMRVEVVALLTASPKQSALFPTAIR